ncbi:MAG TPA: hypothetical protein VFV53_06565 [Candidatus Limnocylindrales bacterium]|nr:hypothetical protein [Candidatus Limnocylindrales bacterium]
MSALGFGVRMSLLAFLVAGCASGAPAISAPAATQSPSATANRPAATSPPSPLPSETPAATVGVLVPSASPAAIPVTPPSGLQRDAMVEVVVDRLPVRGAASADADPVYVDAILDRGDDVFIVGGPVVTPTQDWFLVSAVLDGHAPGPFGWVAAASPDGVPWIQDIAPETCPTLPDDVDRIGVIPEELLIHCFGGSELSFEHDANVYCLPAGALSIEPAWLSSGCGYLSGDACGWCGLSLAIVPGSGVLPTEEVARWSVRGHFDDPAAASCRATGPIVGDPSPEAIVFGCRTTFVLTSLDRLGDASD